MDDLNFYGYPTDSDDLEKPLTLKEVTICCDPAKLREIARFLLASADELEQLGQGFGHNHIQDWAEAWPVDSPDLIVYRPGA